MEFTGVILAAGKGSRIDPFNVHTPKPLLPIGNRPIMGHHLETFRALGIKKCCVVVGHLMDRIIRHFGRGEEYGLEIDYVEQGQILGIAHALGRAEAHATGPFILGLGDIFYWGRQMDRLVERFRQGDVGAVLAVKEETDAAAVRRNFSVELSPEGLVTKVLEKPRRPTNLLKGCGIYVFGPEIFDAVRRTPRTALRDEYEITSAIQIMIDDGAGVAVEPVVEWDLNVTFPGDLLDGNLAYLERAKLDNLIHPTAAVDPLAHLEGCIIGARARVPATAKLRNVVVLEDSIVPDGTEVRRALIARDSVCRC